MKDFDYYSEVGFPCPVRDSFKTLYIYDQGELIYKGSVANRPDWTDSHKCAVTQTVLDAAAYDAAESAYAVELRRLESEFINDLFEEFGVQDNPKRHKLYSIAYDRGHSGGFSDVYSVFSDLVELIL